MTTEILIVLLLIVINGLFSMSELAIVSARKARLQQRAEAGDAGARVALNLAESPSRFLSTAQIGITAVGIFAGAFGGPALSRPLAEWFNTIPALDSISEPLSVGIVVAIITYLSLVIGELVPKHIALNDAERIAVIVARPMLALSVAAGPFVTFLSWSTHLVERLLRIKHVDEPPVTEEEIKILIEQGAEAGVFEEHEQEMVTNVLRLGDQKVYDIMTPRALIEFLDIDDPPAENFERIAASEYDLFPVFEDNPDQVLGIASVKALWAQTVGGNAPDLRSALFDPIYFPENTHVKDALETFRQSGRHIGLVVDEFGGIEGMVTLADVLEMIVGEVPNPRDPDEPRALQREDGTWLLDGLLSIERLKELLDVDTLPSEDSAGFQTVGGYIVNSLRRIPKAGDHFDWSGHRFEVLDMDGRRVDKVLLTKRFEAAAAVGDQPAR